MKTCADCPLFCFCTTCPSRCQGWDLFLPMGLKIKLWSENLPNTDEK